MSDALAPGAPPPDPGTPAQLTAQLEGAVLAVPGVDALYSAAPLVATVVASVIATTVEAVTGKPRSTSSVSVSVSVSEREGGLKIAVKIGVAAPFAAPDVSRRVHDAITDQLDQNGNPVVTEIAVTVARID
ncbi:hypothetical protein E3T34_14915 [Cryobacterium sp. TMT1-62]|uniref:hypothetical protein n=1 Tax=Cryobacterium sp. TMT1-62 TaxID=1259240 RepID=UPI00106AB71B|nr:hypothetical protein [Cryobacterium sp. TMT1-62]TFD29752.1 hypothetical protein E3T34_14915 [Cryobacterium sp. TMT1-62]